MHTLFKMFRLKICGPAKQFPLIQFLVLFILEFIFYFGTNRQRAVSCYHELFYKFLQKTNAVDEIVADFSLLKLGKTLIVGEVIIKYQNKKIFWQDLQLHISGQKRKLKYFYVLIF